MIFPTSQKEGFHIWHKHRVPLQSDLCTPDNFSWLLIRSNEIELNLSANTSPFLNGLKSPPGILVMDWILLFWNNQTLTLLTLQSALLFLH